MPRTPTSRLRDWLGRTGACLVLAVAFTATAGVASATPQAPSATGSGVATVSADGTRQLAAVLPVTECSSLVGTMSVGDTPVTISSAVVRSSGAPAPYCAVTGTIAPTDTIVMRLPVDGWTQRYLQTGCGGECGQATINTAAASGCEPVTNGTIAEATTDMGHEGLNDGSWAADNPQAQTDFAYRAEHVTAVVAKALIKRFYGQAPVYSYFDGCSDGGREGLMEAQRYPHDFDGILAGAPASNMNVQNTFHHAWNVLTNLDENGNYILLAGKLPMLHQAVLGACDGIDGTVDGLIQDPRRCDFDPTSIECTAGQDPSTCLTPAEAGVVRRLHDGAVTANGRRLEPAIAHEWGSELDWTLFIPTAQGQTVGSEHFVEAFARYLGYTNTVMPDWTIHDLKLTVDSFWKTVESSSYLAALDPDLSRFQRGGGKLVLWHGWGDQHISPQNTLAYWSAMNKTMGKRDVASFAKLYLFPGVAHCGGGEGPNSFDLLTPTMAWVESGRAPGEVTASSVATDGTVTRTLPIYPYPTVARYDGTGDVNDAAHWHPVTPKGREPGPGYQWLGRRLFSGTYQTWCTAEGTELTCTPRRTWLTRKARASRA